MAGYRVGNRLRGRPVSRSRTERLGELKDPRAVATTTWANEYPGWPDVGPAFRTARGRAAGRETVEVVFGTTGRARAVAAAGRLPWFGRAPWGIERGRRHARDEASRGDRWRVRRGNAPRVPASPRGVAAHLPRGMGGPSAAAATREVAAHPRKARASADTQFRLLRRPATEGFLLSTPVARAYP